MSNETTPKPEAGKRQIREDFEKWYGSKPSRFITGNYEDIVVQARWEAYRAGRESVSAPAPVATKEVKSPINHRDYQDCGLTTRGGVHWCDANKPADFVSIAGEDVNKAIAAMRPAVVDEKELNTNPKPTWIVKDLLQFGMENCAM